MIDIPGTTLKGGRRKPSNKPALLAKSFLNLEATIETNDYGAKLKAWKMLGNDRAGDCAAVTWANFRRLVTAWLSKENYPSQDQVWKIYKTQNPDFNPNASSQTTGPGSSADQGMDLQTLLNYLQKTGGPDGMKVVAFAKLNTLAEIKKAQEVFGAVWLGINVSAANMTEFDKGQPWDYVAKSEDEGGHSIVGVGDENKATNDLRVITWAKEQACTQKFDSNQIEEAWLVVWPEHLTTKSFETGVDKTALAKEYKSLTGRTLAL